MKHYFEFDNKALFKAKKLFSQGFMPINLIRFYPFENNFVKGVLSTAGIFTAKNPGFLRKNYYACIIN